MSLYESLWYWWISPWLEATLEPVMESWAPHQRRPWARERDGVGPNDPLHTWQNAVDIQISQNHQTSRWNFWNWTERILCFWHSRHSTRASLGAVSGASFPSGKGSTWFKADPVTMPSRPSLWIAHIATFPNFPPILAHPSPFISLHNSFRVTKIFQDFWASPLRGFQAAPHKLSTCLWPLKGFQGHATTTAPAKSDLVNLTAQPAQLLNWHGSLELCMCSTELSRANQIARILGIQRVSRKCLKVWYIFSKTKCGTVWIQLPAKRKRSFKAAKWHQLLQSEALGPECFRSTALQESWFQTCWHFSTTFD